MPAVACIALLSIGAVAQAQQFRTPTIPSNPSAAFAPQPSFEGQLHAEAIRKQMIRAEREQGAPLGFAAQAYRAQQAYAAQQAYEAQLGSRSHMQSNPQHAAAKQQQVAQAAGYLGNFETRPSSMPMTYDNAYQGSQINSFQPPVHLPPVRPRAYPYPAVTVSQPPVYYDSNAQARHVQSSSVVNEQAFAAGQQQAALPSSTRVSSQRPQMNVRPAGLQERITRAFTGDPRSSRNSTSTKGQSTERRKQQRGSVAQSQMQRRSGQRPRPVRPNVQPASRTAKRLPKQAPNGQSAEEAPIRDSQVARAGDPTRSEPDLRRVGNKPVRQTVMQEPVQDPFGDRLSALPQLVDEPEVYRPSGSDNTLRSSRPIGKQISILNRSRDEDPDGYDPPAAPDFQQDASEFSGANRQINDQLDRQLESIDAVGGQDVNESLTTETQNSLRQEDEPDLSPRSLLDNMEDIEEDDESDQSLLDKSCDDFRRELLDNPIRDIALDISPPASELLEPNDANSRDWTDRMGNVVATGRMVDLRRGYVIVDGINGRIKLAMARLSDSDLDAIADFWQIPTTCGVGNRGSVVRCWAPQTFTWTASSLCHKTLYFENVQLERYGHSHGPITQPIHSFGHFFVSLISVPYQTAIHPANECNYALGFYRPGDCAPWLKDPIPISLRGALRQALVVTGLGYAL